MGEPRLRIVWMINDKAKFVSLGPNKRARMTEQPQVNN